MSHPLQGVWDSLGSASANAAMAERGVDHMRMLHARHLRHEHQYSIRRIAREMGEREKWVKEVIQ